ncbi:MAG: hypothetical protein ABWY58_01990 [Aeromicrobium sp.]
MRFVAVALLVVLAACSGGASEPSGPTTSTPAAGVVEPSNPPPTGTPVPEALSDFRCEADGSGTYTATGAVTNRTKAAATFQVTVNVGQPSIAPQAAMTKQLAKVRAGGSVTFEIVKIPVADENGTCHVQVVTTK